METSPNSTDQNLSGLTSSQADFPVRMSATLVSGLGLRENGLACGLRCCDSFAYFDRDSYLWKTFQPYLFAEWDASCPTWPRAGMTQNGIAFTLDTSGRRTSANESSYLPTPTKSMGKRGWGLSKTGRDRYSQGVIARAFLFGYKPPIALLEWMMGFPPLFTRLKSELTETPSSHR